MSLWCLVVPFVTYFQFLYGKKAFWNNSKNMKLISELLTMTDEAFILLCIINYSATWQAQEKHKSGETDVEIPVSILH